MAENNSPNANLTDVYQQAHPELIPSDLKMSPLDAAYDASTEVNVPVSLRASGTSDINSSVKSPSYNNPQDVDISGTLNVSAALSASSALKVTSNQNDRDVGRNVKEGLQPIANIVSGDEVDHTRFNKLVSTPVADENTKTPRHLVLTNHSSDLHQKCIDVPKSSETDLSILQTDINVATNVLSSGIGHSSKSNILPPAGSGTSQSEAFIDGIERFVDFVSKEGIVKNLNESHLKEKKNIYKETKINQVKETWIGQTSDLKCEKVQANSGTMQKASNNDYASNKKPFLEKTDEDGKVEDVDADLKSYAMAVSDMLDDEGEVAASDNNEIDAEIKTVIVSNDDAGELQMTFTDNAVGRFETIGKNEEKGSSDPLADGLSPLRKSSRPKKRKVFADFDLSENADLNTEVESVMKIIRKDLDETNPAKAGTSQGKSKRKNPLPKKAKLTVEEVYESDSNEDTDGDIDQDALKVRMAKCDICQKHFLDRKKLEEHKKRHNRKQGKSSQSDYPCIVCGKLFLKREHWRRHVKIHDDVRPYSCPVCKKGFRRKEHVKRHMLIHTGEKPFQCEFCLQHYQRADHLKKHMMQHEKGSYRERRRKGTPKSSRNESSRRRRPTTKAAKLVAQSRKSKVKDEPEEFMDNEDHYSDGLSDEDNFNHNMKDDNNFENDMNDEDMIYA